jgi:type I restriction enzyme M protein
LLEQKSKSESEKKAAEKALDKLAYHKYPKLSIDEIKSLVVDDKWTLTISREISDEVESVSQDVTTRVRRYALRYETPLPKFTDTIFELSDKVGKHLEKLGASC